MHQVHAHVARSNDSKDRVHVGPVEIKLGPAVVQQPGNLADLRVEDPTVLGLVIMNTAVRSLSLARKSARSTTPQPLLLIVTASKPARSAEAGLVP